MSGSVTHYCFLPQKPRLSSLILTYCSWNAATYDNLLGSNKLFPQPIPLTVSNQTHECLKLRKILVDLIVLLLNTGNGGFSSGHMGTRRSI